MSGRFTDRIVLVTGAGSSIGAGAGSSIGPAIAQIFAREGATVVVTAGRRGQHWDVPHDEGDTL